MHRIIALSLLNLPVPEIPVELILYWNSVHPLLQTISDVIAVEAPINHPWFTGELDCIASYKGVCSLIEWKSISSSSVSEASVVEYCLQSAAYWMGVKHTYNIHLSQGMVFVIQPEGVFAICLDQEFLSFYWEQFQYWLSVFYQSFEEYREQKN